MSKPQFHGLFLPEDGLNADFEPEPIAKIFVTRFDHGGKVRVPRHFAPEELRELADVFQRFGGGTYELEARRSDGSIYAKRLHTLPGEPKALVDATAAASPSTALVAASPAPPTTDPTLAIIMQMSQQNAAMMMGMMQTLGTVLAAALSGRGEKGSSPAEMLAAFAQLTEASKPAPAPAPTPLSEVLAVQDAIEKVAERRTEAATAAAKALQPTPPEESTGQMVKDVVEAVGPLIAMLPQGAAPKIPTP